MQGMHLPSAPAVGVCLGRCRFVVVPPPPYRKNGGVVRSAGIGLYRAHIRQWNLEGVAEKRWHRKVRRSRRKEWESSEKVEMRQ